MTPTEWAWRDIAPRTSWSVSDATTVQQVFVVVLKADGFSDYELPVSTIMLRRRSVKASYVRCTVPDPISNTAAILARSGGRMYIYSGYRDGLGRRNLEEILYANIQTFYFSQGATNILTLAGTRYATYGNPREAELPGVSRIQKDESGRVSVRCAFDLFVDPGDIVSANGETFAADLITCFIAGDDAYMDVEGA